MTAGHHAPLPPEPAPGLLLRMLEARALWEHYATVAMRPLWSIAPRGDGHPVLVLPGLTAGDASTAVMRSFLKSRGFSPSGWGQGLNLGLREGVIERVHERMRELWVEHGRAVSLIGWSLGGLYARELAKHSPEMVRLCITLGSPFTGHPRETNAWRIYEFASGHRVDWHDFTLPLRWAPPFRRPRSGARPTASFPGVAASSPGKRWPRTSSSNSSHLGLGAHPAALYAIADRLAQPEGHWEPFHRDGWRRLVYCDPEAYRVRREKKVEAHAAATARIAAAE